MLIIFSCSQDSTPDNVIPKDKMIGILLDIHIAEAKVNELRMPLDSALSYYLFLQNKTFEKHDTDSATYHYSMDYYSKNISKLDKIYEVVLDSLNLRAEIVNNDTLRISK